MNDALLIPSPTGTTRLYAVVGDPIAQVQAPTLLNRLFAERGIDALMLPVQAGAADFATVIEGLKRIGNLDGLLITVPHKLAVAAHADEQSLTVALTGSSNALRRQADGRWLADNFDGAGFVAGLRHAGRDPEGWRVALFGSGGAGSAIAVALLQAGIDRLDLFDVDQARAARFAARLEQYWPGQVHVLEAARPGEVELAINATPIGMRPDDPLPFDLEGLAPRTLIADIIMKPAETRLLQSAAARGHAVQPGIHMLSSQLGLYRQFFGLDPAQ